MSLLIAAADTATGAASTGEQVAHVEGEVVQEADSTFGEDEPASEKGIRG